MRELGQRIPSSEWPYWIALYQCEPWGYDWENEQQALVRHSITTMSGRTAKKNPKLKDFLARHG